MSRLIDIRPDEEGVPSELVLVVGDVVRFAASGGRVRWGSAVEILVILVDSVVGTDGSILTPMGAPGTVLLRARSPGRAEVELMSGDPFHASVTHGVAVRVER